MAKFANFFRRKLSNGKSRKLRLHKGNYSKSFFVLILILVASTYTLYWAFYQEHNFWEKSKKFMSAYFELNRQIYEMQLDAQNDVDTMEFDYKNDESKNAQREYKDFDDEWIDGSQPTKKFLQTENNTMKRNISNTDEKSDTDKSLRGEIYKDDNTKT